MEHPKEYLINKQSGIWLTGGIRDIIVRLEARIQNKIEDKYGKGEGLELSFRREDCEYTKFNIENHMMEFSADGDGILISIPFAEDTPQCIKDRLKDTIYQQMNKYLETVECMSMPCNLKLNARMQIQYSNNESDTHYYLSLVITDIPETGAGTWIGKDIDISSETVGFQSEFISYCQYQVNKTLFPFLLDKAGI